MMEIEHVKFCALAASALASKFCALAASDTGNIGLDRWIERGGTGLCLILLILAVRTLRGERDDRQARLDSMHDKQLERDEKATEARIQLANTMEKQSHALDKQSDALDRLAEAIAKK